MEGPAWMAAFLDRSGPLFCIKNGASRGLKIMKIVDSGLKSISRISVQKGERGHFLEIINNLETQVSTKMPDLV
jgi:hypothetical protein